MTERKRLPWVDMAKGYGILAIIVSHVFTGHTLSRWLFTFHVPLFFFLSGYVFRAEKPWGDFLKGKLKGMVVPYFALSLPIILAEAAMSGPGAGYFRRVGAMAFQVLLQRRLWPIWFLACLFLLECMGYGLIRLVKRDWILALLGAALGALGVAYCRSGGAVLPWNLDACFPMLPFFLAGFLMKKHGEKTVSGWRSAALLTIFALGNLMFGWRAIRGQAEVLNVFANQYGNPIVSFLSAFCGIFAVILVARWMTLAPIAWLGRRSLLYFVWHQTPVITAIYYFFPRWGIPMEDYPSTACMLGEKALELLIILVTLTLCTRWLERSRLKWVLGK